MLTSRFANIYGRLACVARPSIRCGIPRSCRANSGILKWHRNLSFSAQQPQMIRRKRRRNKIIWTCSGGILAGFVAFGLISHGPVHAFVAIERTSRVGLALILCIKECVRESISSQSFNVYVLTCLHFCSSKLPKGTSRIGKAPRGF